LILLAVVATAFAFVVSVEIMKRLSPFTVAITINLEPVYSIVLALLIFGASEEMSMGFYAGAVIIVATIFANTYLKSRKGRETP
jgi:drug/metabolite transporter (DMT)-like permease